jgi:hypothetical protein
MVVLFGSVLSLPFADYFASYSRLRESLHCCVCRELFTLYIPIGVGVLVGIIFWPWYGKRNLKTFLKLLFVASCVVAGIDFFCSQFANRGIASMTLPKSEITMKEALSIRDSIDIPSYVIGRSRSITLFCRQEDEHVLCKEVNEYLHKGAGLNIQHKADI